MGDTNFNIASNNGFITPRPRVVTPGRQPLGGISNNIGASTAFAGYGMSAGLKASHPTGLGISGLARPGSGSRTRGLYSCPGSAAWQY